MRAHLQYIFRLFLASLGAVLPLTVLAAAPTGVPRTLQDLYTVICNASNWFFAFVMVIAVVAFLYGAILFFSTSGNEQQISRARQVITYALLGVAVAVLAKAFIFIIGDFLGVSDVGGLFECAP
ncbi:MAG: hypothetical protein A2991_01675 [Candidatus Terrybacteria bacterium RIFCSPLOWO2_01_FULL_58_14]|uniref:TrbC/VIRB2 family protein n=2 Tax=Candidatus Terryibacteriota TaxID=1817920 RepID=A0A1G2PY63_9BACT|nr:MAG: hypothetical protein A2682_02205 [Candidatus Terrybacteria bacterium RIFCSPHIGHO2_01_FULL_58_15]OHA53267.1 MAG: hypothetical protein A2991_01675 [Candidatus Terrybacteria bacterium RIFCSPLOWO2_01_FULL_58_14]